MLHCATVIPLATLLKKSSSVDRLPSVLPKGLDNDWNKRPPVTRVSSSQDEPTAAPLVKQKSSASLASDGIKCVSIMSSAFNLLFMDTISSFMVVVTFRRKAGIC